MCLQRSINAYTVDLTNKNMLILKQMYFSMQHYFDPNMLTCPELLLQHPVNTSLGDPFKSSMFCDSEFSVFNSDVIAVRMLEL